MSWWASGAETDLHGSRTVSVLDSSNRQALKWESNPARLPSRELPKEHETVSTPNTDRNPPLDAIVKQQGAKNLDQNKRNQQINHTLAGSRHHGPATFQLAAFLEPLVALPGSVLDRSETNADETASDQAYD